MSICQIDITTTIGSAWVRSRAGHSQGAGIYAVIIRESERLGAGIARAGRDSRAGPTTRAATKGGEVVAGSWSYGNVGTSTIGNVYIARARGTDIGLAEGDAISVR